jgi:peptidoglycan/LPS O-acetylase OafA/YrhL
MSTPQRVHLPPGEEQVAEHSARASVFTGDSPNLDCLRSLAVLFVVVDHVSITLGIPLRGLSSLGYFGVLIFFVHTSLVLMLSMNRTSQSERRLFLPFYVRRAFRIYPLSMVCVLLVVFSGFTLLSRGAVWSNLALVMNFTSSPPAISPMWSLPYEVQMYLLLPLLFIFATRFRSAWATAALFVPLSFIALVQPQLGLKWDIVQYSGCFLPGIIAYQLSFRPRFRWPWWIWPAMLLTIAPIFVYVCSLRWRAAFLNNWA